MSQIPTVSAALTLATRAENGTASADEFVDLVNLMEEYREGSVSDGFEIGRAQGLFILGQFDEAAGIIREVADELTAKSDDGT